MTEYQHIYEKLVVLDGFLHKNDLSSAVTSITEVSGLLESVEKKDEGNQSLLRLLRKAYKRKLLRIKTTLTQLVNKRVVIESDAISVYEKLPDSADSTLSLASLFELLQPLELFDDTCYQLCSQMRSLCEYCLSHPSVPPAGVYESIECARRDRPARLPLRHLDLVHFSQPRGGTGVLALLSSYALACRRRTPSPSSTSCSPTSSPPCRA